MFSSKLRFHIVQVEQPFPQSRLVAYASRSLGASFVPDDGRLYNFVPVLVLPPQRVSDCFVLWEETAGLGCEVLQAMTGRVHNDTTPSI